MGKKILSVFLLSFLFISTTSKTEDFLIVLLNFLFGDTEHVENIDDNSSVPKSKEIYEIYPDVKGERNKEFFSKFDHGGIHRESECCVCLESFETIGKRVTLFCGHSVCANCLFRMMYLTKNALTSCPICREQIVTGEFSPNYLKSHVNAKGLKKTCQDSYCKEQLKNYFPWMSFGSEHKEIYEIYPKVEGERNREFFAKFDHGGIHREDCCCVCVKSFEKIGKRVTLFCGHSICAHCLFRMMYLTRNPNRSCPLCRDKILTEEFSANDIKSHVNAEKLKKTCQDSYCREQLRRHFPWI